MKESRNGCNDEGTGQRDNLNKLKDLELHAVAIARVWLLYF